jgi:ABC-type branched-subunit amino acid transport system permease subunit
MSTIHSGHQPATGTPSGIDPRGPQLTAAVTAVVLLAVLLTAPSGVATVLLAAQTALFALGAVRGVQHTPTSWLFRTVVRPRLAPPAELEGPTPPRFAQAVGLAFGVVGLLGFLTGLDALGLAAVGLALAAALLNAVFRFCLGCELYLIVKRTTTRTTTSPTNRKVTP